MAEIECTTPAHITQGEKFELVDKLKFAKDLINVVYAINGAGEKITDELESNAFDHQVLHELGWRAEVLVGEVMLRLRDSADAELEASIKTKARAVSST
mgnify:CR=1 FL=1